MVFRSVFLHTGEHGLRRLPDKSGHEGEDNRMREGRGGEGRGEVEEDARDEHVEEERREEKLDPHGLSFHSKISL